MNKFSELPNDIYRFLTNYFTDVDIFFFRNISKRVNTAIDDNKLKMNSRLIVKVIGYGYVDLLYYLISKDIRIPKIYTTLVLKMIK